MKKNFKIYTICWAILLALFNVICFVSPNLMTIEDTEYTKFGGAFWAGYIFITLAFIGQLVCAYLAFKADTLKKLFYNISLIKISYTGLILTIIFGSICMAIPNMPNWIGIIVCLIILAFNAIAVVKAAAAAEIVAKVDEKVEAQTQFIKMITVDAQNLMQQPKSAGVKNECKKVYEALRYSDPMSNDALAGIESQITLKFNEFSNAVTGSAENVSALADELVVLIGNRNTKCKLLK